MSWLAIQMMQRSDNIQRQRHIQPGLCGANDLPETSGRLQQYPLGEKVMSEVPAKVPDDWIPELTITANRGTRHLGFSISAAWQKDHPEELAEHFMRMVAKLRKTLWEYENGILPAEMFENK